MNGHSHNAGEREDFHASAIIPMTVTPAAPAAAVQSQPLKQQFIAQPQHQHQHQHQRPHQLPASVVSGGGGGGGRGSINVVTHNNGGVRGGGEDDTFYMADADRTVLHWLACVFCNSFCCLGLIGLLLNQVVNSARAAGHYRLAYFTNQRAKNWLIAACVLGSLPWLVYLLLIMSGAAAGSTVARLAPTSDWGVLLAGRSSGAFP